MQKPWVDDTLAMNGRKVRENFTEWFGASCCVETNGDPKVFYHGTQADFSHFDANRLGEKTGHPTSTIGFYFSEKNGKSVKMYASFDREKPLGKVLAVFLSIQNPLRIAAKDFYALDSSEKVSFFKDKLVRHGHDGVVVDRARGHHFGGHPHHIALHAHQIKSAVDNTGLYLQGSPSLTDAHHVVMGIARAQKAKAVVEATQKRKAMGANPLV